MNQNPPPPPVPSTPQRSGLAVASLVLGIAGIILCLGPLAGIPGVICGHMAQSNIKKSGGTLSGNGLATAGLITGYVSILMVAVIGLLAAIAVPNFVKARQAAQQAGCIINLKTIQAAKETWALEKKKLSEDEPSDADLFGPGKHINARPVCPAGGTYSLNRVDSNPTCSVPGHGY